MFRIPSTRNMGRLRKNFPGKEFMQLRVALQGQSWVEPVGGLRISV
jgi:hypothetical protein